MIEKNSSASLSMNKFPLQFLGILPLNGIPTPWNNRFSNLLLAFTLLCITSLNGPLLHFMISADLGLEGILDALNVVAGALVGEFRMIIIALNRKRIQRLVSTCEMMWLDASVEDSKIVLPWANGAKILSKLIRLGWSFAVTLYVMIPIIKQLTPGVDLRTRSWPYQINMDVTQSPRYEIFYVVQSIWTYVSTCSMIGCDIIGPFLTLHACGQFKLIQSWMINIREEKSMLEERFYMNKNVDDTLKKCLRRHQIVMHFCAELEKTVCYANLAHGLGGMYMMAISATRLTRMQGTGMFKQFGPLCLATGQLLISCWPAEYLLRESTMLAETLYAIPWYRCSPCIRKSVAFMMLQTQRPARLTMGKFTVCSLATFSSILSTSASMFMVLRSFDSVGSKASDGITEDS